MSDVYIFHTQDGGDIAYVNGVVTMRAGLESASYLSMFGGNQDDSGLVADDPKEWWGNKLEDDPAFKYRSETQHILRGLPAVSANLLRVEQAVLRDHAWFVDYGIAEEATATVSLPAFRRVLIEPVLVVSDETYRFAFEERWS